MVEVVQTYEVVRTRTREGEVEPDGHGEVNSRLQAVPTRVGSRWYHDCRPLSHIPLDSVSQGSNGANENHVDNDIKSMVTAS